LVGLSENLLSLRDVNNQPHFGGVFVWEWLIKTNEPPVNVDLAWLNGLTLKKGFSINITRM
jgi:hypothetical protein